eukprot:CAMPEP_0197438778 /NCGR_PEP_ID=MMETSP1175-20131217/5679_1 /TAXON_ID=1003142 /ORGANISM="Triceratium dubium, Strain CCMP147" /LENGTH=128 /DNA_ID=CAMNT_0042968575 /DNA_START=68 /DNA_END=454 /DNA_ORIENTATION=+
MAPHAKTAALLTVAALLQLNSSCAFSVTSGAGVPADAAAICDRRAAFVKTAGFVVGGIAAPAFAKDVDPKLKDTKADPKYQACVSQCIFECTKPKGDEQKSRAECIPECKKQCATSKEQLMIGAPKKD